LIATIAHTAGTFKVDLLKPLDLSIAMQNGETNINAWYVPPPKITPHTQGQFIGSVAEGSSTNFNDISFNPHAHVTHTECLGHITKEFHSVNTALDRFFWLAELVTITPTIHGDDNVITKAQLQHALGEKKPEALILRTLPNTIAKKTRQYNHTNPPYLSEDAAIFLREWGVGHLLVDLPSVDKEKDGGSLLAHRAFWNLPKNPRLQATITEFIFVDNAIVDGSYFLNLQIAPFENDASPSRPVVYKIM